MWQGQWQNVYHLSLGADHPHRPTNSLRTLEYQNTRNRCQSPWLRNKHKVVSTCTASDRWPLGSDLPGVSLLSLFTLNECEREKENGGGGGWKELKRRNKKLTEEWDLTSLYTRTNRGQTATLSAAARSPSLNGETEQPPLIGFKNTLPLMNFTGAKADNLSPNHWSPALQIPNNNMLSLAESKRHAH